MKKVLLLTVLALTFTAGTLKAQFSTDSVFVQVIHNSPDPATDTVDVWFYVPATVSEYKVLTDFAFRTATPVIKSIPGAAVGYIPANLAFEVRVKPQGSVSATPSLFSKSFPAGLPKGGHHVVAQGVLSQNLVDSLGAGSAFDVVSYANAKFESAPDSTTLRLLNGAPDAAGTRVFAGVTTFTFASVVDSLTYSESADATIKAKPLRFWLAPQGTAASAAPLDRKFNGNLVGGLGGVPALIFSSGFEKTSIAADLPSFGLFAALPTGVVVELPVEVVAGVVQIVHNAADPALATSVAAFVSGDKIPLLLNFRGGFQSSSFIADFDYAIGLAANNGAAPTVTFPATQFSAGENRVIFVNGVVNPAQFKANPDGLSTALNLYSFSPAKYTAATSGNTEILVFHGVTDAPYVDVVVAATNQTMVNNLGYGSYTPSYIAPPLPASIFANQELQVKDSANTSIVSRHLISAAQATAITNKAVVAFASGFMDSTSANQNGKGFGLFVVIDNGGPTPTVVELAKIVETSIADVNAELGLKMYPNPASTDLFVTFDVKETSNVSIDILDLNGRVVKNVINSTFSNEQYAKSVDIRDLQGGLYIARVKSDAKVSSYKFNVVR